MALKYPKVPISLHINFSLNFTGPKNRQFFPIYTNWVFGDSGWSNPSIWSFLLHKQIFSVLNFCKNKFGKFWLPQTFKFLPFQNFNSLRLILCNMAQCGDLFNDFSLTQIYVKSILVNVEVLKLPFLHLRGFELR